MATAQANQKVYVSPGVYTSETDLSFVAQSVGVTTLGLVGETIKGPAFEPIFITNYDEFQAYFGGTEPVKFVNTQIPKYEAAYIAKSYLQQSNQLFVTRILGLSGYDAGPSWSIKVTANVDPTTIGLNPSIGTAWSATFTGYSSGSTVEFVGGQLPPQVSANYNQQYRLADGSTSTYATDFNANLSSVIDDNTLSATTVSFYGAIPGTDYWPVVSQYSNQINQYNCASNNLETNDLSASSNDSWYYANFGNYSNNDYSGYSFYYSVTALQSGATSAFTGTVTGYYYNFSGTAYSEYNNMVVATLRSRGISLYSNSVDSPYHGPVYEVSGITDVTMVCTDQYSGVTNNPFASFQISGITKADFNSGERTLFSFETSLSPSSSKYISKVFGLDNFGKSRYEVPLFVEENYGTSLLYAYNQGFIKGLSCDLIALEDARSQNPQSIAYNLEKYQSPETPYLVSELRGNKVYKLFKFISISDGDSANVEVKVSIANLSFNNMTFDVLVRNFFDTDANPVVIEKFTNCNLDPGSNNFIGVKIGTSNGEYALISKYIMVEMSDEAPIDAIPCGFYGYTQREYESVTNISPVPKFKTKYNYPGEVISNPPFGTSTGAQNTTESAGDIVRRTYLGFSSQYGIDESFLTYKGKQNPTDWTTNEAAVGLPWNYLSKGFHMDSGATVVTISNSSLSGLVRTT
jgi:hypothetical protein